MASSSSIYQHRSVSLPSRLHPHDSRIDVELTKLKTLQSSLVSSPVPTSGETIRTGLSGLAELYACVEELIHCPLTQAALVQPRNGALVKEALKESIGFIDSCNVARDLLMMMKQNVQDLQSVLRRKGGDLSIDGNITAYRSCQKKVKKESTKCIRALKKMEKQNNMCCTSISDVNYYLSNVIRILREVSILTISILRSFFLFLSMGDSRPRWLSRWSLIKMLVVTRPKGLKSCNEIGSVDVALQSLHGCIGNNHSNPDVQITRRRLEALGDSMEGLETELDCLFRQLVKNRVSILNILAQ